MSGVPISEGHSVYDLDLAAIGELMREMDQPPYRAAQLRRWLYERLATSYGEMTSLPKRLRTKLAALAPIRTPTLEKSVASSSGETRKDTLRLSDGAVIEAVLMRYERRRTACISTQVGCAVGCAFCATGRMGLDRDLTSGEILAQVVHFARVLRDGGERLTNVVLMGMGEPLLNYDASVSAVRRLTSPEGFGIGQRRVTVSTVGVAPAIHRLAGEELKIRLAVSLHAATDSLRDTLAPINCRYPLEEVMEACRAYAARSGRRVSFEWVLIAGVNDSTTQAAALAALLTGMPCHVNVIPLNPTTAYAGRPPDRSAVERFAAELARHRIPVSIRLRRGIDAEAGCGQLATQGRRGEIDH